MNIVEVAEEMDPEAWDLWLKFAPLRGSGAPFVLLNREELEAGSFRLVDVLILGGLFDSKSECHRKMKENAVTVWNRDKVKLAKLTKDRTAVEDDFRGGVIVGTKSKRFFVFVN